MAMFFFILPFSIFCQELPDRPGESIFGLGAFVRFSLNTNLEQDHRGIKQRYYPMLGFGTVEAAARFCCACARNGIIFVLVALWAKRSLSWNNDELFSSVLPPCRH
jgi:hypothetical protein